MKSIEEEYQDLKRVQNWGGNIQHIKDPSEDVKFEAVRTTPYAIQYIDDPSEAIQLMAVRQKPYAVQYIKYPTQKVINVSKGIDPDFKAPFVSLSLGIKEFFMRNRQLVTGKHFKL